MRHIGRSTSIMRAPSSTCAWPLPWLLLLLLSCRAGAATGQLFRTPLEGDITPRLTITTSGLEGCRRFQSPAAVDYGSLLLEADGGRLYVGARGGAFSLDARDISANTTLAIQWETSQEKKQQCLAKGRDNKTECFNHIRFLQRFNSTHLYMCGTYAFSPLCVYVEEEPFVMSSQPEEGKEKCPYGPATGYTGLIVEQQMYSAARYEFRSFPDLRLNGPPLTLKTEDAPIRWLNDADFVGSALVRESVDSFEGDDDKIYFFFTEGSEEQTGGIAPGRVARVARICKGDRGGLLTLQKRWTTFLKARLVCSQPEYDFHFNVLRSVFVLRGARPRDTVFYGIFGLDWRNVKASAVCRFSLSDVQQAFQGPYMESQNSGSKWTEYTGKVPQPRPGTCITDELRARDIALSTSLPDDVLDFVRRHPLMARQVQPLDRHPLVYGRTTDYTHMAVDAVPGLDGQTYHVLFMGTDDGRLHRAVSVDDHLHIIEELQLFEAPQPISSLVISPAQMSVYVGSPSGVVQLPLSTCHRYASCYDCVFARDPYCGWNSSQCVPILSQADRSALIQDIQKGNRGCENTSREDLPLPRRRAFTAGDDVLLQCELTSNLATPLWTRDGARLAGYGLDSGIRIGTDGLLIIKAQPDQRGLYTCHGRENGVVVAMVSYNVTVRLDATPPPPPPPRPKLRARLPFDVADDPPEEEEKERKAAAAAAPEENHVPRSFDRGVLGAEPPLPAAAEGPLLPHSELLSPRNMKAMYLSLITILGGLCVVLSVVLLYVGFCLRAGSRGHYSLRAAASVHGYGKRKGGKGGGRQQRNSSSSQLELKTVSSHCNGHGGGGLHGGGGGEAGKTHEGYDGREVGLLQIVPGEGHSLANHVGGRGGRPPAAPPLPSPSSSLSSQHQQQRRQQTPPSPEHELSSGLSATLPSVLRRMNGNSYVLLRQSDAEAPVANGYAFNDELSKRLEKRKHTQLLQPRPDESSV
ncbi:semaphorin-4G-like [Gadus macrocephalus]|uniref:semaphorin-4G-like n=1 Tax=Gadus macrocephalus TaxID=80720 RepID=UPI0028CB1960|nr:semaphorin-4G-like [Gadus macrocephalus]